MRSFILVENFRARNGSVWQCPNLGCEILPFPPKKLPVEKPAEEKKRESPANPLMCWICDANAPPCEWAIAHDKDAWAMTPSRRRHHRFDPWNVFSSLGPPHHPGASWTNDAAEGPEEASPPKAPRRDIVRTPGTTAGPHQFGGGGILQLPLALIVCTGASQALCTKTRTRRHMRPGSTGSSVVPAFPAPRRFGSSRSSSQARVPAAGSSSDGLRL